MLSRTIYPYFLSCMLKRLAQQLNIFPFTTLNTSTIQCGHSSFNGLVLVYINIHLEIFSPSLSTYIHADNRPNNSQGKMCLTKYTTSPTHTPSMTPQRWNLEICKRIKKRVPNSINQLTDFLLRFQKNNCGIRDRVKPGDVNCIRYAQSVDLEPIRIDRYDLIRLQPLTLSVIR